MRKLSFIIASLSLIFSVSLNAQQTNVGSTPSSPNGDSEVNDIEFIIHNKVALTPGPDGGLGARIIEYTDNNGNQVVGKPLPNEIVREVNCDCGYDVQFTGKKSFSSSSIGYSEDGGFWRSVSDGKYKIEIVNRDTHEILYTLIAKLHKGKLKVKREFNSANINNEIPFKVKKKTPLYFNINFNDEKK
jgi:hypothetical protein